MSSTRLNEEINKVLDRLARQKTEWDPTWIANQVVKDHNDEIGSDFIRHCTYEHVRKRVGAVIRKRTDPTGHPDPHQLTMEGYDHLQLYYTIDYGEAGEQSKPTTAWSDEALMQKAEEMRVTAQSLMDHADEIERFVRRRKNGSVAR